MMSLEGSVRRPRARGPGRGAGRSFQEAAAAAGRLPLPLPHSNGERQMESYPLCQLFSQSGRARPPGPLGSCRGRRTDAWTGQSVSSPISLLPPPPVIQAIWTFTYYAPDEMRHILMAPAAVRVRQCDRIGDDELDAADWLSASVLALPPGPSCAVLCPVRFRDPVGRASSLVTC